MTMNHHVKSKSQTPISNRMKREDFLKILDNRKNERREQRLRKMNNMDEIQEEDIGQKKPTAEENLIIQIKQISQTNAVTVNERVISNMQIGSRSEDPQ